MSDRFDFLSVQVDYWDSPWQNRHAFVWELSKSHGVFFLSPPFYFPQLFDAKVPPKTKMKDGLTLIKDGLWGYVPPRYLFTNFRFPRLDRLLRAIRHRKIRSTLMQCGFGRPILYIWHPRFADLIGQFDESFVIYHKYDHYAGYFGGSNIPDPGEQRLLREADLVMVTSQGLFDLHKDQRPDLQLVPNGVDYELFSSTLTDMVTVPAELESIPGPRIGYVGVINEKVDFKLLIYLCQSHPEWSIVLVGPEKVTRPEFLPDFDELKRQKNCYFLGRKEGRAVPAYVKGMDVCMMCYLVNDWTYYGYPLKMHEYLACGKPTVSADLPAVREFSEVVVIPADYTGWCRAIEQLLIEGHQPGKIAKRLAVAHANSWSERINKMISLVKMKLAQR